MMKWGSDLSDVCIISPTTLQTTPYCTRTRTRVPPHRNPTHPSPPTMSQPTLFVGREKLSRDWARRVVLAVGEREARLEATDRFRGADPPRYVCPQCHEYGCSSADGLDEHLRNTSWHDVQTALQVRGFLLANSVADGQTAHEAIR